MSELPVSHAPGRGHHEEEHEEHVNHEAWVIPYADMLTLLMALFLMLWATSTVNEAKFAALADSLRDAFGNGTGESQPSVLGGAPGVLSGQDTGVTDGDKESPESSREADEFLTASGLEGNGNDAEAALQRERARAARLERENATLNSVQREISKHASEKGVLEALQFERQERGLVITVVTDDVLFVPGSSELQQKGQQIITVVTQALTRIPNRVMIEGHTDSTPIATAQFPSNWELSSGRGTSVLRYAVDRVGLPASRVAAAGYGDTHPVKSNDTADGRSANRRVEVVVLAGS